MSSPSPDGERGPVPQDRRASTTTNGGRARPDPSPCLETLRAGPRPQPARLDHAKPGDLDRLDHRAGRPRPSPQDAGRLDHHHRYLDHRAGGRIEARDGTGAG
jgi:hypothetical protein